MAEGHGWGGASRADSNHPAPACANAAPPYPRRGVLLVLMSPCLVTPTQYPEGFSVRYAFQQLRLDWPGWFRGIRTVEMK